MTRRLAAAILGAVLLLSGLPPSAGPVSFGPPSVHAAASGMAGIAISPSCLPASGAPESFETRDVEVEGHGFEPGSSVPVRLYSLEDPPVSVASVDAVGAFRTAVSVPLPAEATGIRVLAGDPDSGPIAETFIQVPCRPSLQVDPTCADPARPFDLAFVASGFQPDTEIRVSRAPP